MLTLLVALVAVVWCAPAHAQLRDGAFRLTLDTSIFSVAGIHADNRGDAMVFGVGPNQLGAERVIDPGLSPLGLGLGWAVTHKIVLGLRTGLGYDIVKPDGDSDNVRVLVLSLMPGITFVPIGNHTKLFLNASPIFQVNRVAIDGGKERYLLGGFGLGIGALIFVGSSLSVDLGFHFEGRFGNLRVENRDGEGDTTDHYRILQGVFRLGLSLWK